MVDLGLAVWNTPSIYPVISYEEVGGLALLALTQPQIVNSLRHQPRLDGPRFTKVEAQPGVCQFPSISL